MLEIPARWCQTLFLLAQTISLIYLGWSDSGKLFSRTLEREQMYPAYLCLWLWKTKHKNFFYIFYIFRGRSTKRLWSRRRGRKITLSDLQKFAVWLYSTVKPPLSFQAVDFTVIPRHLLVRSSGDQLLELRCLTDDGLFHGFSLHGYRNVHNTHSKAL